MEYSQPTRNEPQCIQGQTTTILRRHHLERATPMNIYAQPSEDDSQNEAAHEPEKSSERSSSQKLGGVPEFDPSRMLLLHERVVQGDPEARDEIALLLLSWLKRKLFILDPHVDGSWL